MTSQPQHQPTGVYSDTEIIAGLEQGHIVCDPAPAQINGSSIDVTLGYYFTEPVAAGKTSCSIPLTKPVPGSTLAII